MNSYEYLEYLVLQNIIGIEGGGKYLERQEAD
jgi:hypothetical protein